MFNFANAILHITILSKTSVRSFSFWKFCNRLTRRITPPKMPVPPYKHVCQIGDPVLRTRAIPVELEMMKQKSFQKIVQQMTDVMRNYQLCSISACQLGLSWQIFAIEITQAYLRGIDMNLRTIYKIDRIPLQIFINPKLTIKDYTMFSFPETCGSIQGFSAVVPRAKAVEIVALNISGEEFTWPAKDWAARLAQHEYDHLQGICYVDKMDTKTYRCDVWQTINLHEGYIGMRYEPVR